MIETEKDLEKVLVKKVILPKKAAALLAEAPKYGIDVNSLENFDAASYTLETNIINDEDEKPFWYNMDVKLGDLFNPLMNDSERPLVLVSDDLIVYANQTMMQILGIKNLNSLKGEPFLSFVDKNDWGVLTSNIGEMLTSSKKQRIQLKTVDKKDISIEFQAIYLPDSTRFSFILVGNHSSKANKPFFNNLYDDVTGVPNFFLFEDRVQMAVNYEKYKDARLPRDIIAVLAINVENIDLFKNLQIEDFILRKIANRLVSNLKKNYTIARGLKYTFWVMMPDLMNEQELDIEVKKLWSLFREGISDNFTTHELKINMGISVFPNPASSAKKLIEQAIFALKNAQEKQQSAVELYNK